MARTLRMCLMVHVEDNRNWAGTTSPYKDDPYALAIGSLAAAFGAKGAKLSVQFDRWYLDRFDPFVDPARRYPPPTSLRMVIENGGNFWVHNHVASFNWGQSTYACVMSAFQDEKPASNTEIASEHVSGRSGGWSFDESPPYDWVSITQAMGMRRMNSAVMQAHVLVPTSMRPYGLTDDEIQKLYQHDAAPGPLDTDVMTMRTRPFWMNTASTWFERTASIYPDASWVGSVMMIPVAGRFEMKGMADRRSAYRVETLTVADLNAALTQIWSTFDLGRTAQNSITGVWYAHLNPNQITANTIGTLSAWVDSVNEIMTVGATAPWTPFGAWANMNEIANLFSHYDPGNPALSSFYY